MQLSHRITFAIILLLAATSADAQHADPDKLQQAAASNSLTKEGNIPFHLKMNFQLFDLDGKPSETGTIEEWWAAPQTSRLIITSPSYNHTFPADDKKADIVSNREQVLVWQLLDEVINPMPDLSRSHIPIDQESRTFGNVQLSCFTSVNFKPMDSGSQPTHYCVDPKNNALRIQFIPGILSITRNSPGLFHQTNVALDIQVTYEQKVAISGKVVALESFDPSTAGILLSKPHVSVPSTTASGVKGGVIAGKVLTKMPPSYPLLAKQNHISGSVVLKGLISREGKIKALFAIASPDPSLTQAAIDAVKQWTYQPYLLNGEPTEVDTSITVNFNLNR